MTTPPEQDVERDFHRHDGEPIEYVGCPHPVTRRERALAWLHDRWGHHFWLPHALWFCGDSDRLCGWCPICHALPKEPADA